jgi:hypothetical protein
LSASPASLAARQRLEQQPSPQARLSLVATPKKAASPMPQSCILCAPAKGDQASDDAGSNENVLRLLRRIKKHASDDVQRVLRGAIEEIREIGLEAAGEEDYDLIFDAMESGYNEFYDLVDRTGLEEHELRKYLTLAIQAHNIEEIEQGGKTDMARGPRKVLYFTTEKWRMQMN